VSTAYRDAFLTNQNDDLYSCFENNFNQSQCNLIGANMEARHFREEKFD
jgi:hypothetical protein